MYPRTFANQSPLTVLQTLEACFYFTGLLTLGLPYLTAFTLSFFRRPSAQETILIQCFSLLLLGMFLSALATLNFSLSFLVGLLAAPLTFVRPIVPAQRSSEKASSSFITRNRKTLAAIMSVGLSFVNPVVIITAATYYWGTDVVNVLVQAAEGWHVWGMWTQLVVWLVWWPAWFAGAVVVAGTLFANEEAGAKKA